MGLGGDRRSRRQAPHPHPIWEWDGTDLVGWIANGPESVGYDPYVIPMWSDGPTSEEFAVLRLHPYRLRVMAGAVMAKGQGVPLTWHQA